MQVAIERRRLGAVDRLAQGIAVDQPRRSEQRQSSAGRNLPPAQHDRAEHDHRERDQQFGAGHARALHVQSDTDHHRQHETDGERRPGA